MRFADIPFPTRPIALTRGVIAPPRSFAFSTIVFLALAIFLTIWQAPGLIRDVQISQNPVVIPDAEFDGECSVRRGITDCDADLIYSYDGQNYSSSVSMQFMDIHAGDYETGVVISGDKPELATLELGLTMLWNRLAVFGVLFVILAGGALFMIWRSLKAFSQARQLRQDQPGRLQPVYVSAVQKDRGGLHVTYFDRPKGEKGRQQVSTRFAKGRNALMSVDDAGELVGVGLLLAHSKAPVLLDSDAERIDLNPAERQALLDAVSQHNGDQAMELMPTTRQPVRRASPLRGVIAFFGVLLFFLVAALGYWLWYVTSSATQFEQIGMEINNIMPEPLNSWGCEQLQRRFANDRAPYGCTAGDYTSWK